MSRGQTVLFAAGGATPETVGNLPSGTKGREKDGLLAALAGALALGQDVGVLQGYLRSLPG
jgi:hypothetical protein